MLDEVYLLYGLFGICIILLGWIIRLEMRLKKLSRGKDGGSLEEVITSAHHKISTLETFQKNAIEYFKDVERRLTRSVQAVETLRFNPFKGTGDGGNQSFSTAFVNEKGDGVVISSLYSRERVSVFSKPINAFKSDFELTEEEGEVLGSAQKKVS